MSNLLGAIRSRTVWFGTLVAALGAFQEHLPLLQAVLTPQRYWLVTTAIGVAVVVLRTVTDRSLKDR